MSQKRCDSSLPARPRHPGRGVILRLAKSNRRPHLTLSQSGAGVTAPSWRRREEALGASALGVWALPELQRPLSATRTGPLAGGRPLRTRRAGGRAVLVPLRRWQQRWCRAAGARGAGWRCVAPPASSGASTRRGCAPGSRAVHGLAPAAAVTAADPAPGGSLAGGGDKDVRVAKRSSSRCNRLSHQRGIASKPGLGRREERRRTGRAAAGKERGRALPLPCPCGPLTSQVGVRGGEGGRGLSVCSGRRGAEVGVLAPSTALAFPSNTPWHSCTLRMPWPHSSPVFLTTEIRARCSWQGNEAVRGWLSSIGEKGECLKSI